MLRTTLRNLAANKLRLLTTGLAVLIGVAFMSGTMILSATMAETMDDMFASAYEGTDALVRSSSVIETPEGTEIRPRIDEAVVDQLAAVDGVAVAQADVWGVAQVIGRDGDPVGQPEMGPPTVGASWPVDELNTWTLEEGRAPAAADEVVIDRKTAEDGGYAAGDRAQVLVNGAPIDVTVSGVVTFAGADSPGGASFSLFTVEAAQQHFGEVGKVDSVSLAAEEGVSQEELVERIAAIVPGGLETITGDEFIQENQDAMAEATAFFDQFMMVFAVVALLVGGFTIFNTFFITVAQRTKQHALMRAIGASRRQVLVSILLEAVVIGIIASAIGLGAGVVIAAGLKAMLTAFGVALPAGGMVFGLGTAVVAFSAGLIVTVVSAVSPARKAGKVPPIAAMRDIEVSSSGYGSKERIMVGVAVLALGAAGLLYGLFGSPSNGLAIVGGSAIVVFFGVSVLGRTVSLPMSRVIGWPLAKSRGIAGHLARQNAMRSPKRTAATAAALMIGVGLVSFITIFASSTKASFNDVIDRAFTGDVVITSPQQFGGSGGMSPELTERVAALPEVETAAGVRGGVVEVDGSVEFLLAADEATFDVFDVEPVAGSPDDLDATSIAVFEDVAQDRGLSVGDTVDAAFVATGPQELTVALIYGENQPAGDWLLGKAAYEANYVDQLDAQIFIKGADGVAQEDVLAAVEAEAAAFPGAKVLDQNEYKAEQLAFVDQMLGLVYAMLALAIIIALLGIGNTLALSIFERTRELGVLRAVGMTRRQLRSTIRWESVIIAVQGAILGLAIGIFFGWALVAALAEEGLTVFAIPVATLVWVVVLAALAGVAAAILPARRAARLDVLRAVVSE
ncbi:FtsX-like permease family protein [Acidimicrobiia bacterium EGI L10123]|uniref:ABC transporter permease n=1 Tax=Salinilacustrithrix flava TaxID=2957203 RepID=UPI003D7C2826|nr:FtsX-like permease family protein [Acidimicrobiia bacterium EGI L10123]